MGLCKGLQLPSKLRLVRRASARCSLGPPITQAACHGTKSTEYNRIHNLEDKGLVGGAMPLMYRGLRKQYTGRNTSYPLCPAVTRPYSRIPVEPKPQRAI